MLQSTFLVPDRRTLLVGMLARTTLLAGYKCVSGTVLEIWLVSACCRHARSLRRAGNQLLHLELNPLMAQLVENTIKIMANVSAACAEESSGAGHSIPVSGFQSPPASVPLDRLW
jgi:uncharacterized Fe-S cluster protein YjdI